MVAHTGLFYLWCRMEYVQIEIEGTGIAVHMPIFTNEKREW